MRRLIPFLLAPFLTLAAFAGNPGLQTPDKAAVDSAKIVLKASDGEMHTPLAVKNQTATVLVFLMHDCPVTNAMAPELARLSGEFAPKGVQFFGVYATETAGEINEHRRDYGLPFPGLLDPKLQLAQLAGVTRAPEAAVFSPDGTLLYRGRIDDRVSKPGVTRPQPSRRDLRLALEAILAGRQPEPRFTTAIGCYLPTE
ncbi:redoxin domain-containing protein [Verrucomicrobiota bacterium sgz303538]